MRPLDVLSALACCLVLSACSLGPKHASVSATDSAAYMTSNAKQKGVVTLPDGLQYKVIHSGPAGGVRPRASDEIKVNYEGKLTNGKVFDSSWERGEPMAGPLRALIPAWVEALQLMHPGDVWELYVPPKLGYGDQETGPIPANSVLIFKIELIDVLPVDGNLGAG